MKKKHFIVLSFAAVLVVCTAAGAKHADLAGSWYTESSEDLKAELEGYLEKASPDPVEGEILGGIVPHAGFRYSGPVAAYVYRALQERKIDKVIVVGFTHRKYLPEKVSVFTDGVFVTPLGRARIDRELAGKLIEASPFIQDIPQAFASENSVEMEIPFIQAALKDPELVLIAIGDQKRKTLREVSDALYGVLRTEKNFVILASTDMCHYLPYDEARTKDMNTMDVIKKFDPELFYAESMKADDNTRLCGFGAVYTVMDVCRRLGAEKVQVLKYENSGDTSGMKNKVVGYMSAVFVKPLASSLEPRALKEKAQEGDMFSLEQKKELLKMARNTIAHYLKTGESPDIVVEDMDLQAEMGAFVTLHKKGQLRGCIGHMVATGPLYLTVRDMAIAAATGDPRFPAMRLTELDEVDIEISVLSPMRKVDDPNEIEMGKHGVMVKRGWKSGVYLPQVADETGWSRDQFMNSLCSQKAGIPADSWKTGEAEIYVYTAEVFGEKELSKE